MCEDFTNWVFVETEDHVDWHLNVSWTDEAHFSLSGSANAQNCRIWAKEKLWWKKPLLDLKVTVLCGFTTTFVIGSFYWRNEIWKDAMHHHIWELPREVLFNALNAVNASDGSHIGNLQHLYTEYFFWVNCTLPKQNYIIINSATYWSKK